MDDNHCNEDMMSTVTGSTENSDEICPYTPTMCRGLYGLKERDMSRTPSTNRNKRKPSASSGCDESPLIPFQTNRTMQICKGRSQTTDTEEKDFPLSQMSESLNTSTHDLEVDEDHSEMSELLIPLIHKDTGSAASAAAVAGKPGNIPDLQETQVEASQSLLPQTDELTGRTVLDYRIDERKNRYNNIADKAARCTQIVEIPDEITSRIIKIADKPGEMTARRIDIDSKPGEMAASSIDIDSKPDKRTARSIDIEGKPEEMIARSIDTVDQPRFIDIESKPDEVTVKIIDIEPDEMKVTYNDISGQSDETTAKYNAVANKICTQSTTKSETIGNSSQELLNHTSSGSQYKTKPTGEHYPAKYEHGDLMEIRSSGSSNIPTGQSKSSKSSVVLLQSEMAQPQRALTQPERKVTLSQDKMNFTDKINARLSRLVANLGQVPRKQMVVMEAAIIQCVAKLQDSLHARLSKYQSKSTSLDQLGMLKNIIHTTQTSLTRLIENHKLQHELLSQSVAPTSQHDQLSQTLVSPSYRQDALLRGIRITELGKRQKEVHGMFKRQKLLVQQYKEIKRCLGEADVNASSSFSSTPIKTTDTHTGDITDYTSRPKSHKITMDDNNRKMTFEKKSDKVTNILTNKKFMIANEQKLEYKYKTQTRCDVELLDITQQNKPEALQNKLMGVKGPVNLIQEMQDTITSQDVTTIPDTQEQFTQDATSSRTTTDELDDEKQQADLSISSQVAQIDDEILDEISVKETVAFDHIEGDKSDLQNKKTNIYEDTDDVNRNVKAHGTLKRAVQGSPIIDNCKKMKTQNHSNEDCHVKETIDVAASSNTYSETLWLNKVIKPDSTVDNKTAKTEHKVSEHKNKEKGDQGNTIVAKADFNKEMLTATKISGKRLYDEMLKSLKNTNQATIDSKEVCIFPNTGQPSNKTEVALNKFDSFQMYKNKLSNIYKSPPKSEYLTQKRMYSNETDILHLPPKPITDTTSPPHLTIPCETFYDVSPTATSMSSDVFMVKSKELEKRMNQRAAELSNSNTVGYSQNNSFNSLTDGQFGKSKFENTRVKISNMRADPADKIMASEEEKERIVKVVDTINEAIDSVIKNARKSALDKEESVKNVAIYKENVSKTGKFEEYLKNYVHKKVLFLKPQQIQSMGKQLVMTKGGVGTGDNAPTEQLLTNTSRQSGREVSDKSGLIQNDGSTVQKDSIKIYKSLKELVQNEELLPGKNVLSINKESHVWRASLTPMGKIRTPMNTVFTTPMQWLSSVSDGEIVKKSRTYQQVMYKGVALAAICKHSSHSGTFLNSGKQKIQPGNLATKCIDTDHRVDLTDRSTDGFIGETTRQLSTVSDDKLNRLLSTCEVRLLSNQHLIPCDDLPDNFWTEDFSKVQLHSDIWNSVDEW